MKNILKDILLITVLMGCNTGVAIAEKFEVVEENLYFDGVLVPSTISFEEYDNKIEVRPLFSYSTNSNFAVIKIIFLDTYEFWLFNKKSREILLVDSFPTNLKTNWLTKETFMLERESMGASISLLYYIAESNQIMRSGYVKHFLGFDDDSSIILSWAQNEGKLRLSNFDFDRHLFISVSEEVMHIMLNTDFLQVARIKDCRVLINSSEDNVKEITIPIEERHCAEVLQLNQRVQSH